MGKRNIALIIAGIMLTVGIFSATAGGFMGGVQQNIYIDENGVHTAEGDGQVMTTQLNSFNNIDILMHSGKIELIKSDRNAIEYRLENGERLSVCDVMNDTFVFKTDFSFSIMMFGFRESYIKLYYKDGSEFDNVSLKTSSGSIYADGITANSLYAKSSSGSRNLSNIKADKIDISGSSGSAKLANITANDIYVKSSSGSISVEGMECKNFTANNSSGSIKLNHATTQSLDVRNTSGSIYVQGTPRGKSVIYSTSGSVKVYSSLPNDEYGYKLSSTSGSTKVNDETFKGSVGQEKANFIDASATSGSVKLYFNADR
ncbi:MAG: DUF4097 family beta strand repeat-containing protein [Oscillospiraceae bacterium]